MNFVNEDHIARAEIGEDGSQIARAFDGGACRHFDVDSHLIAQHVRERGLAQTGRTVKQNMIQGFTASTRHR